MQWQRRRTRHKTQFDKSSSLHRSCFLMYVLGHCLQLGASGFRSTHYIIWFPCESRESFNLSLGQCWDVAFGVRSYPLPIAFPRQARSGMGACAADPQTTYHNMCPGRRHRERGGRCRRDEPASQYSPRPGCWRCGRQSDKGLGGSSPKREMDFGGMCGGMVRKQPERRGRMGFVV